MQREEEELCLTVIKNELNRIVSMLLGVIYEAVVARGGVEIQRHCVYVWVLAWNSKVFCSLVKRFLSCFSQSSTHQAHSSSMFFCKTVGVICSRSFISILKI